ncbi:carbohydrate-binding protein [Streptomyces jumonjinensis]|uniref:carbohydrate-binding protein n=1 Tax=Streptomyces jumonjinensis TaxID=1945 RepID=UPI00379905AE
MTAGNNGASTPEDDDPFGYLYEDGHAAGATPPSGRGRGYGYPGPAAPRPGVPRTSYNQVRAVGERQYGQQPPQQGYPPQGQPPQGLPQQGYGQPSAQYAAPETYPGGPPTRPTPRQSGGRGGGRGPNTKGLLIGAIAVVVVVIAGITAAVISNSGEDDQASGEPQTQTSSSAPEKKEEEPEKKPAKPEKEPAGLPKRDAATLDLGGPAALDTVIPGAKGTRGAYVAFNGVGGSASWSVDVPAAGEYTMTITYSVPGKDAKTSLTVNGETPRDVRMSNFAKAGDGEWEKGWTYTYSYVNLKKGKNDLKISCEQGNQCDALLDQVWLEAGRKS